MAQVFRRTEQIRQDVTVGSDGRYDRSMPARGHDIHHWQCLNPVTTEALIMLTLGAPQLLYNGGLLLAPLRYFDADKRRAGVPEDVAALVENLSDTSVTVTVVNLNPIESKELVVQGGGYAEHEIGKVSVDGGNTEQIGGSAFTVRLKPGCGTRMEIETNRYANQPTFAFPWDR